MLGKCCHESARFSRLRDLRGSSAFTVKKGDEVLGDIELGIPGRHNVLNALAVLALARELGVSPGLAAKSLASFEGVDRRFSIRGVAHDVMVGRQPREYLLVGGILPRLGLFGFLDQL